MCGWKNSQAQFFNMFVDTSGMGRGGGGGGGPRRRKPPKLAKKQQVRNNSVGKLGADNSRASLQFPDRTLTEETFDGDLT